MASTYTVEVVPDARGWSAALQTQLAPQMKAIAEQFERQLSNAVRNGLNGAGTNLGVQGARTGSSFADAFERTVRAKLEAASRSLPKIKIDANSSDVDREVADIRRKLEAAGRAIQLGVDTKLVDARVDELRRRLLELARNNPDIKVRVNAGSALTELEAMRKEVDRLDGRNARIKVAVDRTADLKLLQTALTLTPAVIPLAAGLAAAATAAVGLAGAAGVAFLGLKNYADRASTDLVQTRANALMPLVNEWERLGAIRIAPGIAEGLHGLQAAAPVVTRVVSELSSAVGDVIEGIGVGLPKALRVLEPLLLTSAGAAERLGDRLAAGPSSDGGFAKTLQYMETSLPSTIAFLEHLTGTLGHLLEAAAPVGGVMLDIVDGVLQLIEHIPTPYLTAAITAFTAYRLAAFSAALATKAFGASVGATLGPIGAALAATLALTTALNNAQSGSNRGFGGVIAAAKNGVQGNVDPQSAIAGGQDPTQYGYREFFSGGGGALALRDVLGLGNGLEKARGDALVLKASIDALVPSARTLGDTVANIDIGRAFGGVDLTGSIKQVGDGYNTITGELNKYLNAAQQLDGVGTDMSTTINGVTYSTSEYQAALQQTNGDTARAVALMEQNRQTASRLSSRLDDVNVAQGRLNDAVAQASTAYGLSADQVSVYAQAVGISTADVAAGIVSADQFSTALFGVSTTLKNANTANAAWLEAVGKFNVQTATAADTAGLLSAALTASRGDALDYATSMSTADQATQGLAKAVHDNLGAVASDGRLLGVSFVDAGGQFQQAQGQFVDGSAAILQATSGVAQSATAAAAAQYQHDAALVGTQQAAQNALTVYTSYRQELIAQATQSGLTADQAQALADKYFAMPTDVSTFVKMLGQGDVTAAISSLTVAINNLSNVIAKPTVSLDDQASAKLLQIKTYMASINSKTITLSVQNSLNKTEAMLAAQEYGGVWQGGIQQYAYGGFNDGLASKLAAAIPSFAQGGLDRTPRISMPTSIARYAELSTQGEAFIPFAQDRRARAEAITTQVAQRFGGAYLSRSALSSMRPASVGRTLDLTPVVAGLREVGDKVDQNTAVYAQVSQQSARERTMATQNTRSGA